jgi:hypothetical protein
LHEGAVQESTVAGYSPWQCFSGLNFIFYSSGLAGQTGNQDAA